MTRPTMALSERSKRPDLIARYRRPLTGTSTVLITPERRHRTYNEAGPRTA